MRAFPDRTGPRDGGGAETRAVPFGLSLLLAASVSAALWAVIAWAVHAAL